MKFISSPLKASRIETPSWFIFLLPASTSMPVSSQNKAICGDFTEVLASLETSHSPNPTETSATNLAERARWQLSYKCWLSPPGKGTESCSLCSQQSCRPQGPPVWAGTEESSRGAESWHYWFTQFIVSYCHHKPTTKTTTIKGRKKEQERKVLVSFYCFLAVSWINPRMSFFRFLISIYKHTQVKCDV